MSDPQHPEYQPPSESHSRVPEEETLARGLHHIVTTAGTNPLTEEQPPVLLQAITLAAHLGQEIPTNIPPLAAHMDPSATTTTQGQQANHVIQYSNGSLGGNALPTFDGNCARACDWMQ